MKWDRRPCGCLSHFFLDHHPIHHDPHPGIFGTRRETHTTLRKYYKELKMKTNVYDKGRAPDVPQFNESGKPTPRKAKAPAREFGRLARGRRTARAGRHSARRGRLPPDRASQRRGNHAGQRTVLCLAPARGGAHRGRQRVCHPGCVPVRYRFPAAPARLAPRGRADRGSMRTAGWFFSALDDPVLSPPGWRRGFPFCIAAPVRLGHDQCPSSSATPRSGGGM